ncbi:MAG: ABC transporter permease [Candidatus Dormibacteria bacterium]
MGDSDPILAEGGEAANSGSVWRLILDVFLENHLATVGLGVIVFMVLFCFVGPLIYHTQQIFNNPAISDQTPSLAHPLGTDPVGYDVLGRMMLGGQSSLEIAFAAALIAVGLGVVWGAIAGLAGGILDSVMMRVVDTLLAFPFLFALILLGAIFTTSIPELIIVIGLIAWLVPARLVRGETLSLRTRDFVLAARAMGGSRGRVLLRHIIPNTVGTIVVNATFQVADAIIFVATLSYLGLGVPAPATNWGTELAQGLNYLFDGYWWLIYPPGIAIVLTVVAFNFVGDAIRDALEVRLQRR